MNQGKIENVLEIELSKIVKIYFKTKITDQYRIQKQIIHELSNLIKIELS